MMWRAGSVSGREGSAEGLSRPLARFLGARLGDHAVGESARLTMRDWGVGIVGRGGEGRRKRKRRRISTASRLVLTLLRVLRN